MDVFICADPKLVVNSDNTKFSSAFRRKVTFGSEKAADIQLPGTWSFVDIYDWCSYCKNMTIFRIWIILFISCSHITFMSWHRWKYSLRVFSGWTFGRLYQQRNWWICESWLILSSFYIPFYADHLFHASVSFDFISENLGFSFTFCLGFLDGWILCC